MNHTTPTIQVSHEAVSSQKVGKGVCVGGGVGFMYIYSMSCARAGTRMRDRVGAILANAKSIWLIAHNAPLSERECSKLKANVMRNWKAKTIGPDRWNLGGEPVAKSAGNCDNLGRSTRAHVRVRGKAIPTPQNFAPHRLHPSLPNPTTAGRDSLILFGVFSVPCLGVTSIPPNGKVTPSDSAPHSYPPPTPSTCSAGRESASCSAGVRLPPHGGLSSLQDDIHTPDRQPYATPSNLIP